MWYSYKSNPCSMLCFLGSTSSVRLFSSAIFCCINFSFYFLLRVFPSSRLYFSSISLVSSYSISVCPKSTFEFSFASLGGCRSNSETYLIVLIIERLFKLQLYVCIDNADLLLRLALGHTNGIVASLVVNVDFVPLSQTCVVRQLCF